MSTTPTDTVPPAAGPVEPAEAAPARARARRFAWRPSRPDTISAGLYLLLALWTCGGLFLDPYDRVSAHNPNDQIWFQWLLEHGSWSVRHLSDPLFSMRQNYPLGVNLMANTSVLGISIPLAPLTMLFGSEITYWIFLVGGLAGTAYASYWVFSRHLVGSRVAAWLGGAVIGFAPGIIHHANGQPNFSTHFVVPFIVLVALRLGREGRTVRDGVVLALLIVYQFFINQEVLLIATCGVAVVTLLRLRELAPDWRRILGSLGITGLIAGVLLVYPMWFQFNGRQSYSGLPFDFHAWGEDLTAYVTFARDTLAGDEYVEKTIGGTEQNTWFGWPLVIVLVTAAALLWRRSRVARLSTITGVVFVLAAVGPELRVKGEFRGIPGPWALVSSGHVPVLNLLQPTRLTLVVVGIAGMLVALAWDRLSEVRVDRRRWGYAAIAVALIPTAPWIMPTMNAPEVPAFITEGTWRRYTPEGYTVLPSPVPNNSDGIYSLRYNVRARQEFPIPHGYFIGPDENGRGWYGPVSRKTTFWVNHVQRHGEIDGHDAAHRLVPSEPMIAEMKRDLVYWKVAVVLIGPTQHREELRTLWTQVLGSEPQTVDGAYVWDVKWLTAPGATR
jgi:hypothetical protein